MKDPADMSRDELAEEVRLLRELLEQRQAGPFVSIQEGEKRTLEMIARKRAEMGMNWEIVAGPGDMTRDAREYLDELELVPAQTLQRYLSDLARLGVRYGIELQSDLETGCMRLVPLTPEQGGYYAERVDDGPRVLASYGSGMAWDDPTDGVVGDDMHPDARAERARRWREDNAEAIEEHNQRELMPLHKSRQSLDDD
ncbi:hypothetical protein [Paracoccus beibuensis]|uniref:hypothetical protein n=1 Tax=Paracoccus beibuensis TaxID=547602 RepID=UPI0022404414|nr:hypothetical protein [Paracoccus beibuensis]